MLVIGITDISFGISLMSLLGVGPSFFSDNTSIDRCRSFRSRCYKIKLHSLEKHSFKGSKPSTVNPHFVHVKTEHKGLKKSSFNIQLKFWAIFVILSHLEILSQNSTNFINCRKWLISSFSCVGLQGSGQRVSRRSISFFYRTRWS